MDDQGAAGRPSVFLDLSGSVTDDGVVEMAAQVLGVERLLFGCDMSMTAGIGRIRGAELDAADKARFWGATCRRSCGGEAGDHRRQRLSRVVRVSPLAPPDRRRTLAGDGFPQIDRALVSSAARSPTATRRRATRTWRPSAAASRPADSAGRDQPVVCRLARRPDGLPRRVRDEGDPLLSPMARLPAFLRRASS